MKKTVIILAAAIIGFSSCGGDGALKKDIESTAKLECEKKSLQAKIDGGDSTATAQYDKVSKELDELEEKMMTKYKDKMSDKSFQEKAEKMDKEAKEKFCGKK